MSDNVVSIDRTAEQLSFHGFPIAESRYSLTSKPLLHGAPLEMFQHVSGTFEGRVKAVGYKEHGELELTQGWVVEVLEARLDA